MPFEIDFQAFEVAIAEKDAKDLPVLYALGAAWASWIEAHKDDWNAVAELSRIEVIMQRVVDLDESYQGGGAHLYLGVMATLLPPALGGKPELGRNHFERAIEISEENNLMAKVIYARQYARLARSSVAGGSGGGSPSARIHPPQYPGPARGPRVVRKR
jgi:hypothetical protein